MAINFPNNPTVGQTYTNNANELVYRWSGSSWDQIPVTRTNYITKETFVANAGVEVVFAGNIRLRIPSSGNRALEIATTANGLRSIAGSTWWAQAGIAARQFYLFALTTTFTTLSSGLNFTAQGAEQMVWFYDEATFETWRITMLIGPGYSNNTFTIEKIHG